MKPFEIILGLLRIPVDFCMTLLAFFLAYQLRSQSDFIPFIKLPLDLQTFPPLNEYLLEASVGAILLILLLSFSRLYSLKYDLSLSRLIPKIFSISINWLVIIVGYFFFIRHDFPFSRLVLIYAWLFSYLLIVIGRIALKTFQNLLHSFGIAQKGVIFIGNNEITNRLYQNLKKNRQLKILGFLDDKYEHHTTLSFLGKVKDLEQLLQKLSIDEIIQTSSNLTNLEAQKILEFCREHHLRYSFVPDLITVQKRNIEIEFSSGIPIIQLKPTPLEGWGQVIKRIFDIIGSLVGIIIFSPIFVIVAILVKLDSKGTVLYKYLDDGSRVKRVGRAGKLFHFYKFRTMYPNTHNLRYTELSAQDIRKGAPVVKIKNDPRVTKIGKFLRKTSLDEIPQFFNVLKGEMSFVGPRPHLPEEVAKYQKHHKFVLTIKPGISGLAQISGRSDLDFEEEIRLDTYYIENWSLWLDIKIILKTFLVPFQHYKE